MEKKARRAEKNSAPFLREAEKNRKQIEKLEKENNLLVQCRKNGWRDLSRELEECTKVLEEEAKSEKANLQKQLVTINKYVKKFQAQLEDVKPSATQIETLKEIMSEVELSINSLKEQQQLRLGELLKEECMCRQEITAFEKKIEMWKKNDQRPKTPSSVKSISLSRDLPPEVRELEVFQMKNGGIYGGWDQSDHQAFLKVWTKHSGHPAYKKEARLYLPGKTLEEIEQHEEWQQKLIHLQEIKKEAIQRWRASKHREVQLKIQSQNEAGRREKEAKNQVLQHKAEVERKKVAQRLEEWREQKRKIKLEAEQRLTEKIAKRRKEKEEHHQQQGIKNATETLGRLNMGREYGVENKETGRTHGEEERKKSGSRGHTLPK
ncbi:coiled-coil domain-containing protein 112 [Nelusetta ayraudi]|uniref:coiled-coil domain-containing protein 112 n=1 Tax=Nelusetta ayraudi TaxID=303726 RepID=UPI003F729617